jgi:hypothetical protein
MSRFERIARDLEKLPVELHNGILVELEFQQIIRLTHYAGPRLTSSLEDSLSPWGAFFRDGNTSVMQKLSAITDRLKIFCFKLPKSKDDSDRDTFEYSLFWGSLFFLRNRGSEWRSSIIGHPDSLRLVDAASLSRHWLSSLNEIAVSTTQQAFHTDYSRLIEPWLTQLDGATAIFGKIPRDGDYQDGWSQIQARRTALSIEELSDFIDLYQQLRVLRAEALAEELYRLADLYETHSSLLKMPFAPQTPRLNKAHIPSRMRYEARKIVKRASTTWWKYEKMYPYRFGYPFPALIPYTWTIQLFCKVLHDDKLSESLHPETIAKSCKAIMQEIPAWAPDGLRHVATGDMAGLSNALDRIALGPKYIPGWQNTNCIHAEDELKWLERFADVIAWMEVEFPDAVQEVRGHWDKTATK